VCKRVIERLADRSGSSVADAGVALERVTQAVVVIAREEVSVPEVTDLTFYRSPAAAIAAPPERLAYVAVFDPAGTQHDAMAVVDSDAGSSTYGKVVGWAELPTAGNELHHFGWNACSSVLCHEGHAHGSLERRYLIVPGIRSSRTYVLDTKPDPRQPPVVRTIEADELAVLPRDVRSAADRWSAAECGVPPLRWTRGD
jgi:hypothetical protein